METNVYNISVKTFSGGGEKQVRIYSKPIKENYNVISCTDRKKKVYSNIAEAQAQARRSLRNSMVHSKNMIYDLARENRGKFRYFLTLTFNPKKVDSYNYDKSAKKVSYWLNNLKKKNIPELYYLGVPELHQSGRYHFHFLISDISDILEDSGHKTSTGQIIYNVPVYRWGFSTATEINSPEKCCAYICKYITKDLLGHIKFKKRYWRSKNLVLPAVEKDFIEQNQIEPLKRTLNDVAEYHKTLQYMSYEANLEDIDIYELKG